MELLQLRYFFESSKNENFAKTAEKYMVPPTSVSASVKRLEKEFGCTLFDRASNKIYLNENGKRLQQALYIVFSELESAKDDLSYTKNDKREIKMLVRAMRSDITDCIIHYNTKYPNIVFKTNFNFTESDFKNYDIIIDEHTNLYPDYESFELCSMWIKMKASSKNKFCGKNIVLKQLSKEPFVSLDENSNMHKILINACNKSGFTPNIVVLSNDIECHRKLIAAGIGIGLERERNEDSPKLTTLEISDFTEKYTVHAYYKKSSAYGNIKHFLDFLERQMKDKS